MSQNQEIIEAKLCSYIDGALDPEGRAEIEKHLEANPQHRRLLESLRATRDLLRWLPREPAPPELAESLNGQLERSVLLDYDGSALRPSPWPRILAAAAIVALTAGLGAAVFLALPGSQKTPAVVFRGGGQSQAPPSDTVPPAMEPGVSSTSDVTQGQTTAEQERLALAKREESRWAKGGAEAGDRAGKASLDAAKPDETLLGHETVGKKSAELDQLALEVSQDPDAFIGVVNSDQNASTEPAPPGNPAVVMLVRSDSPQATEQQLTRYFASNQILWRQAAAPAIEATSRPATRGGMNLRDGYSAKSLPELDQDKQGKSAGRGAGDARSNLERGSQTQPSDFSIEGLTHMQRPLPSALAQNAMPSQSPSQREMIQANYRSRYGSNGVYVAQMSRRQAEALNSTINRGGEAASAAGVDAHDELEAGAAAPNLNSAAAPPALGRVPTTTASGNSSYLREYTYSALRRERRNTSGMKSGAEKDKAPTTRPSQEAYINSQLGAGLAPSAAPSTAIQQRTDLLQQAANGPTTHPADVAREQPTTQSADEPVNVVILVQPQDPAVPNSPTTQPAAQPAEPNASDPPQTQPTR